MADQESDHDIEREMIEYYFHCGYENYYVVIRRYGMLYV
jgi:hypothetical protein